MNISGFTERTRKFKERVGRGMGVSGARDGRFARERMEQLNLRGGESFCSESGRAGFGKGVVEERIAEFIYIVPGAEGEPFTLQGIVPYQRRLTDILVIAQFYRGLCPKEKKGNPPPGEMEELIGKIGGIPKMS